MEENSNRKSYSASVKFKVVKEALTTDSTITDVCKKYGIGTNVYYKWQEQFFESALSGLERGKVGATRAELRRIEELEKQNTRLKDVVAELTSENIDLKKKNLV